MGALPIGAQPPRINGRTDQALLNALSKISPQARDKAKASAQDFEAMFLNSMFGQMFSGVSGEGPMGATPGTGVWRSMLVDEYSKSVAKAGGVGISSDVFRTLIMQQAAS